MADCWTRPALFAAVIAAALLNVAAVSAAPATSTQDTAIYAKPGRLVRVGPNHRINLRCMGKGEPTVVLEAGAGNDSSTWRPVQRRIAEFTTVCSYDRAGLGHSDPITRPVTAANATDDLNHLLRAARIKRPVVLVGHSMGGLYATMFADEHLADVAGLVLVDPSFAGSDAAAKALMTDVERSTLRTRSSILELMTRCLEFAKRGSIQQLKDQKCNPPPPPDVPEPLRSFMVSSSEKPEYYETALSDLTNGLPPDDQALSQNDKEEMAAARSFGALPLIVLTASRQPNNPAYTAGMNQKLAESWRKGHDALAARSSVGRVIAVDSGHFIHVRQPDIFVSAIREVVEAARSRERSHR
jgi:pimeloyl-ACP methyl ester carboxylesterase